MTQNALMEWKTKSQIGVYPLKSLSFCPYCPEHRGNLHIHGTEPLSRSVHKNEKAGATWLSTGQRLCPCWPGGGQPASLRAWWGSPQNDAGTPCLGLAEKQRVTDHIKPDPKA